MLILFDKNEKVVGRLSGDDIIDCIQAEAFGKITTLEFTIKFELINKLDGVEFIGHKDTINEGSFQLYKIHNKAPSFDGMDISAVHTVYDELASYGYIRERILSDFGAGEAVEALLSGSRWELGYVEQTAPRSISFYDNSRLECLKSVIETWDIELNFRLIFANNKITHRYIDIYNKRGTETGKRYVYGSTALEVIKEESQAGLYTASIGRGKGEQKFEDDGTPTGGYGRRINFKDVEWKISNGDPVNKPLNQEFVEIPEMTAEYGFSDGTPRFRVVVFNNVEDPAELLQATYDDLLINSRPLVEFKASIDEAGKLDLGDTISVIRKDLNIYYKTRVFAIKRDIKNKVTLEVKLGDNLNKSIGDFNRQIKDYVSQIEKEANENIENAVGIMQKSLSDSMFDDNSYYYNLKLGNEYGLPAGIYTFDRPIDELPTKALYFGAGKFAISNTKDSQDNFIWETFGTGDGFVADMITTGTLNANLLKAGSIVGGSVSWNLNNGALNINDDITYSQANGVNITGRSITLNGDTRVNGNFNVSGNMVVGGTISASNFSGKDIEIGPNKNTDINGNNVKLNTSNSYITISDRSGGRGEIVVNGTIRASGSGYSWEFNSGGVYGGGGRVLGVSGSTTQIHSNANGSPSITIDSSGRVDIGSLYVNGTKIG